MMTFNEKRRWVFSLVPTACSYAKLNGYFGKLRSSEIEVLQAKGDFGGEFISAESYTGEKATIAK